MKPTIVTFAGSARRESLNMRLAMGAARVVDSQDSQGIFLDLADYPLPLYDGDIEASEGIPINALALARVIRSADGLFIASPEYNGAYSALLKNTLDWLSRVDRGVLSRPTAIASASPGSKGGANGLEALRSVLEHMRVPVIEHQLSIPFADAVLGGGNSADMETTEAIHRIVSSLLRHTQLESSVSNVA